MAYTEGMKCSCLTTGLYRLLPWCLCLLCLPLQVQATPQPHAAAPPTLLSDLQAMPPASIAAGNVVLTVSPQLVLPLPPPNAGAVSSEAPASDLPAPDTSPLSLESLAIRYGRINTRFGHVCTLAPATMTILNTSSALAALPLGQLAGQHPETYLLGSLTPEQLKQVGASGLAYTDMTPDQQSLMHALLPEPLEIVPATADLPDRSLGQAERTAKGAEFDAQIQKVSGEALFSGLRLHAYLTSDFFVHAPVGYGIGDTRELSQTTGAFKLPISGYGNMEARGKSMETALRADVPNVPKPGDLDWRRRDLQRPVALGGGDLKTVNALTARLAQATGLELYADTHYGPQSLLAVGNMAAPQPAGDVMQALALCVCGTWRRVGPAYVLTDDMQGLGTRHQFLDEIGQVWSNRLSAAGKEAGARLQNLDWLHNLSFVPGDLGALSSAQVNAIQKEKGGNEGTLRWKDLPSGLQDHLRDHFLHYGDDFPNMPELAEENRNMKAAAQSVRPDTPVQTTINMRLAVELPNTGAMMLYGNYRVQSPEPASDGKAAPDKVPDLTGSITLGEPLRAVLCAPKTAEEARAVVAKLPGMGLNTLYLDVFTNGRAYFPNTALPPVSDKAAGVLQAALDAAKPLHISVYAALDTFCWRKDGLAVHPQPWPQGYQQDLTVSGEAPDRMIQRRVDSGSVSIQYEHPRYALASEGTQGWASPLDPAVRTALPPLVATLAATKGLAGIVFQDTSPPGYGDNDHYGDQIGLGYTLANRLAYLRRTHQDPVDLSTGSDSVSVFVGSEFFFGHYSIVIPTFDTKGGDYAAWTAWRAKAAQSLLASCWQAARAAAPSLLLLRRAGLRGAGFVLWVTSDQADPQALPAATDFGPPVTARSILGAAFGPDEQAHPERFVGNAQEASDKKAGGLVFDLITGGPPDSLIDTLNRLNEFLKAPDKIEKPGSVPTANPQSSSLSK